ncbi:DUF2785 domain-containing protein [Pseudoalteromonas fenneropenaei]|uniref:DUF2785 domain-containing protein n=1 Tax=Pseudoalteromonas fenneropenaei TaxID=1737459 RepID=A0ABV7CEG2_9GAMM
MKRRYLVGLVGLISIKVFAVAVEPAAQCSEYFSDAELSALKTQQFIPTPPATIAQTAQQLLTCIGHPNPHIRDGVVYEAYQHWLRGKQLDEAATRQLLNALMTNLKNAALDEDKFLTAFSALILAEVVRVDRITPYLSSDERQQVVDATANLMRSIDDYRGFNAREGWRHLVAHTADIALQLALNPEISEAQAATLVTALLSQVSPTEHAYHFGEPKRLALPLVYFYLRGKIARAALVEQLKLLASPAPFATWQEMYQSELGLAKIHNTTAFFNVLYVMVSQNQHEQLQALLPELQQLIKALP